MDKAPQNSLWLIWSNEHRQWWAPGEHGYCNHRHEAGRYSFDQAVDICRAANEYQTKTGSQPPNETMVMED